MSIIDPPVIRLCVEGGAIEIYGRKEPDGSWTFIGCGTNLEIEDDGNDRVTVGGIPTAKTLDDALPSDWVIFNPTLVHPELREWFRNRYEQAVASLPDYRRELHMEWRHRHWKALFDSTPPDEFWGEE
jgi:hypothetical protein